uniref:Mannosyltransferase n=3 Tax=Rhodnius TaxID=13248 RepID=T1HXP4_RHOPR
MVLTSILIYLVAACMARSDQIIYQDEFLRERYNTSDNIKDRVKFHRLRLSLPWHTFSNVLPIATVTVLGTFNRPTFLAYAFPPVFFWLHRGLGSRFIGLNDFNMRMIAFCVCSLPVLLVLIVVDSVYYGQLTVQEIMHKNISLMRDLAMTPYNFIKYNVNSSNLVEHGLHPRFTHTFINIPLLYNVLGISGIFGFVNIIYRGLLKKWSSLPRVQSIIGLMTTSFIIPIAVLSIFPHQEARFLIPCTLALVFLHSQRIRHVDEYKTVIPKKENGFTAYVKKDRKFSYKDGTLALWYLVNIIMTVFFGFVHQGGVYPLITHFSAELNAKPRLTVLHLVTSHIYTLPISLLQLKYGKAAQYSYSGTRYQKVQDFYTYELGSANMESVALKLNSVLEQAEKTWSEKRLKYKVFLAIPSSITYDFQAEALKHNLTQNIVTTFYPHVSTEALPYFDSYLNSDCQSDGVDMQSCPADLPSVTWTLDMPLKFSLHIAHQFGLTLLSVKK